MTSARNVSVHVQAAQAAGALQAFQAVKQDTPAKPRLCSGASVQSASLCGVATHHLRAVGAGFLMLLLAALAAAPVATLGVLAFALIALAGVSAAHALHLPGVL